MKGHGEKLTKKKEAVIVALLLEPTLEKAAARVGISESTLWRWTQLESFQAAYREARREAVSQAIGALQRASSEAVEALRGIMQDPAAPATARESAARSVLEFALKGVEIEDILARLEIIENANGNY
jgi:hypothetical protein